MTPRVVIALTVTAAAVATLALIVTLEIRWRRGRKRESAARIDSMIEVVSPRRAVTDPFLIALERELAEMDRKIRGDLNG